MNTLISFEIAKLLKEKGYPFEFITVGELKEVPLNIPTITQVVMWLYEKHGVWIYTSKPDEQGWVTHWQGLTDYPSLQYYSSPTEAYKAAIEYTLKNLL
jgi:hypothetical protein